MCQIWDFRDGSLHFQNVYHDLFFRLDSAQSEREQTWKPTSLKN